jgi:hypothetical protein
MSGRRESVLLIERIQNGGKKRRSRKGLRSQRIPLYLFFLGIGALPLTVEPLQGTGRSYVASDVASDGLDIDARQMIHSTAGYTKGIG